MNEEPPAPAYVKPATLIAQEVLGGALVSGLLFGALLAGKFGPLPGPGWAWGIPALFLLMRTNHQVMNCFRR